MRLSCLHSCECNSQLRFCCFYLVEWRGPKRKKDVLWTRLGRRPVACGKREQSDRSDPYVRCSTTHISLRRTKAVTISSFCQILRFAVLSKGCVLCCMGAESSEWSYPRGSFLTRISSMSTLRLWRPLEIILRSPFQSRGWHIISRMPVPYSKSFCAVIIPTGRRSQQCHQIRVVVRWSTET